MWPGVAGNLAKFEDKLLRTRLAKAKLKEKQSLHSRPKHCEAMVPTCSYNHILITRYPNAKSAEFFPERAINVINSVNQYSSPAAGECIT